MAYASIDDLRSQLGARPKQASDSYAAKMLHQIPDAPVVDREAFVLEHCTGKAVLEFGASGPLHDAIMKVASTYHGVDRQDGDGVVGFDLDDVARETLPETFRPDVVICGEVIEHLGNPLWFLTRLQKQFKGITTIITTPNAFNIGSRSHLKNGIENVNIDHCCWFSFRTLKTLLGRAGYKDFSFAWYKGEPLTAEGFVILCEGPR